MSMVPTENSHKSRHGASKSGRRKVGVSQTTLPLFVRLFWPVLYAIIALIVLISVLIKPAHGGGPRYIAGNSYFDAGFKGLPLTWRQGIVAYYTDQGNLSALLPHSDADMFVSDAFSRWTGISTAAVAATNSGQLAEDVNGTNVFVNADQTIAMPVDILPAAIDKPLGVVYDSDGAVTDALLGEGASDPLYCNTNDVFGGPDNLSTDAHIVHALVVINGHCAQTTNQLGDLKYHLVRVLGRTLGLAWSQTNLNVITRQPVPTADDYAGFSILHATDLISCVPVSVCYPNADQPKMDDRAAVSRLYPVTSDNIAEFPGKQLFEDNTARIHGTVQFVDANGAPAQPMQGVNVVARWIDPGTGKASRATVAASVSGFLFRGNAGNPVSGPDNPGTEQRFDQFGSDDTTLEGSFDLAGLEIPNGANSAQYQLTIEAVDPAWSQPVEPYGPWQVEPSGTMQPIIVTVSKGGDTQQDLLMLESAQQQQDALGFDSYENPVPVPSPGEWIGTLSGYGDSDYVWFMGQVNRTLTVEVSALDESGNITDRKVLPMMGIWGLSDPSGNRPLAASTGVFNTEIFGMTKLDATVVGSGGFRLGISDFRGDGRPDFRYHARVLYGDAVSPERASVRGGTALAISGLGFTSGLNVTVGGISTPVLSSSSNQLIVSAPAFADGVRDINIQDPVTGSKSTMTGAVTSGAAATDVIRIIYGGNPPTPVGTEAANPIRIGVFEADGLSPVAGASVSLTAAPAVSFSACGGATSCTVFSDDAGEVITRVTPLSAGASTITASLAPASYNPPQIAATTLVATSSALDFGIVSPNQFVAEGVTMDLPITGRVLSFGVPLSGRSVKFQIVSGTGTLSKETVSSDSKGFVNTTLHLVSFSEEVQVVACVEPGDHPCETMVFAVVPPSMLRLEEVSGISQVLASGQSFQPVTYRVTDTAVPGDPVRGASVLFQVLIERPQKDAPVVWLGDGVIGQQPMPVILGSSSNTVVSDGFGIVSLTPSTSGFVGPLILAGTTTAGVTSEVFQLETFAVAAENRPRAEVSDSACKTGRECW